MSRFNIESLQETNVPSLRNPQFHAYVGGKKVELRPQQTALADSGRVRLGTSHRIWAWLFGKRG